MKRILALLAALLLAPLTVLMNFQALETGPGNFPGLGKSREIFSKAWKNPGEIFQALELTAQGKARP